MRNSATLLPHFQLCSLHQHLFLDIGKQYGITGLSYIHRRKILEKQACSVDFAIQNPFNLLPG